MVVRVGVQIEFPRARRLAVRVYFQDHIHDDGGFCELLEAWGLSSSPTQTLSSMTNHSILPLFPPTSTSRHDLSAPSSAPATRTPLVLIAEHISRHVPTSISRSGAAGSVEVRHPGNRESGEKTRVVRRGLELILVEVKRTKACSKCTDQPCDRAITGGSRTANSCLRDIGKKIESPGIIESKTQAHRPTSSREGRSCPPWCGAELPSSTILLHVPMKWSCSFPERTSRTERPPPLSSPAITEGPEDRDKKTPRKPPTPILASGIPPD